MSNLFIFSSRHEKNTGFIITIFCVALYYVSLDDDLTKRLITLKVESNSAFGSNKFRYGDLYGMSNLANFRKPLSERIIPFADCKVKNEINLYSISDSYFWSFLTSNKHYCGVDRLEYARVNGLEMFKTPLDTSKINVLLLGLVERNIRGILANTTYLDNVLDIRETAPAIPAASTTNETGKSSFTLARQRIMRIIFNQEINTNLESNLWDYSFLTPIKEAKAAINYKLLKTTDKEVTMGSSGDQLFYRVTIDSSEKYTSSFNYVADAEISTLVETLNRLETNAKLAGFDTVFLSLIPNPVSILDPEYKGLKYNRLVERIQSDPALRPSFVDMMPELRAKKKDVYYRSDTHWNPYGASVWLAQFNKRLEAIGAKKK